MQTLLNHGKETNSHKNLFREVKGKFKSRAENTAVTNETAILASKKAIIMTLNKFKMIAKLPSTTTYASLLNLVRWASIKDSN